MVYWSANPGNCHGTHEGVIVRNLIFLQPLGSFILPLILDIAAMGAVPEDVPGSRPSSLLTSLSDILVSVILAREFFEN